MREDGQHSHPRCERNPTKFDEVRRGGRSRRDPARFPATERGVFPAGSTHVGARNTDSETLTMSFSVRLPLLLILLFPTACAPKVPAPSAADRIGHGAYLVRSMGCSDCHTPMQPGKDGPEPELSRLLSGHPAALETKWPAQMPDGFLWAGTGSNTAFAGPWGVSFASNLTSDPDTGLGAWTESQFLGAIKTGKHQGDGRPILPPMPWPAFRNLSDDDLRAIFAYLQTVPAVRNAVPSPLPPQTAKR